MTYHHTMAKAKVALTIDEVVLRRIDDLVRAAAFTSRSHAVETALREKLERVDRNRLAEESAKLDSAQEKLLAEQSTEGDLAEWPAW
jgi:Arc/MetJ-type ribon-helix-helix transcriptional regulator